MSSKSSKSAKGGVRYTDAQKQEVVSFVLTHNAAKGRGGVNQAVKRFKISPITINAWVKASGKKAAPARKEVAPAKKAAPVKKAAPAKKKAGKGKTGKRYTPEQKKEVVDFVVAFNAKNGRGGQNKAAKKFKMSVLTVSSWLKAAGVKKGSKAVKAAKPAKASKAAAPPLKAGSAERELAALKAALRKLLA